MKTLSKTCITICIIILLVNVRGYSQVNPIPKFKGELPGRKSSTVKIEGISNIKKDSIRYYLEQLKSNKQLVAPIEKQELNQFNANFKYFSKSSRADIFNAVVILLDFDYKDTVLFTEENQTIYIYAKRKKIKFKYLNTINDEKYTEFQNTTRSLNNKQLAYDSIQGKIGNLMNSEIAEDNYKTEYNNLTVKSSATRVEIKAMQTKLDSIQDNIVLEMEFSKFSCPIVYSFYKTRRNSSKIFNQYYYGRSDMSVLQSLELSRSIDVTNLNTELANGFFRTFRISLAANINAEDNDTSSVEEVKSDYQKLITNGGQLALRIQSPLFFYHNSSDDISAILSVLNRTGMDVIPEDPDTKNNNINNYIGGDFSFFLRADKNVFSFFAQLPFGYTFGNSQFYEGQNFKDYSTVQAILGVTVQNQFRIKFTGTILSSQKQLQNAPWSIGFQFTPSVSSK